MWCREELPYMIHLCVRNRTFLCSIGLYKQHYVEMYIQSSEELPYLNYMDTLQTLVLDVMQNMS